jgi:hypothetical protein
VTRSAAWAFSDESERGSTMLLGLLLVPVGEVHQARRALQALLLPGQRRIHTSDESARRRRQLLDVVASLDASAVVLTLRRPASLRRAGARDALLTAAAHEVTRRRVVTWVLDAQHPAQAVRDRRAIDQALRGITSPPIYDHHSAASEPLLWAVDAVVWAVGAGNDWRRRVEPIVTIRRIEP